MANIREIQSRINSVKDTMKITNAMYMISSSKLIHAKKKLADTEPYFYALQGEISRILRHLPNLRHSYFAKREHIPQDQRKIGSIVVTADKGLAGAYNHNIVKLEKRSWQSRGSTSCLSSASWGGIILRSGAWRSIRISSIPCRSRPCTAPGISPACCWTSSQKANWMRSTSCTPGWRIPSSLRRR